jgi:hypothetical protein
MVDDKGNPGTTTKNNDSIYDETGARIEILVEMEG